MGEGVKPDKIQENKRASPAAHGFFDWVRPEGHSYREV